MRRRRAATLAAAAVLVLSGGAHAADEPAASRIEAHSTDLLAVGIVRGERLSLRLSSVADNAPVHDALVEVSLRGTAHATNAEADGSYTLVSHDLTLPGSAGVVFKVTRGAAQEELHGTLQVGVADKGEDKGTARQGLWWVLNFAVCIGFLWLWSRRRDTAST